MMNTAPNAEARTSGQLTRDAQPMFHRILRADPMVVRETLTDIRTRFADDIDEDALGRLELVLAEVMNNVTEHGAGGEPAQIADADRSRAPQIHLCIVRHEGGLSCSVTDDGISLPVECVRPRQIPDMQGVELPEGGFGWFLIQDLTQELCYYREERRNFLAFRLPLAATVAVAQDGDALD